MTRRMKRLLSLSLLSVATMVLYHGSALRAEEWSVRRMKSGEHWFPLVEGKNREAADRMNDLLYLDLFEAPPPPRGDLNFEGFDTDHITLYELKVLRNDGRILSFVIEGEGCGAYCEGFRRSYAFYAPTGRSLRGRELFTGEGFREVARRSLRSSLREIREHLRKLRTGADSSLSPEERRTAIEIFEECRNNREERLSSAEDRLLDFRIQTDSLTVVQDRCSNHAYRSLDEPGRFSFTLPIAELGPLLSPFGRSLLLGKGPTSLPLAPFGQILIGRVGNAKVHLAPGKPYGEGRITGKYYYTRYRKLISLRGKVQGKHLILTEWDEEHEKRAQWILHAEGRQWVGEWIGNDGKKYPIRLR